METIKTNLGKINIPKETIENIVRINIADVKGVVGSKKTIMKEVTELLTGNVDRENKSSRNIKVEVKDNGIFIDLFIILKYGVRIPDIAWEIQNRIKKELNINIGAENIEINIHIQGIQFSKKMQSKKDLIATNLFVKVF